jgi:hypothetical protein
MGTKQTAKITEETEIVSHTEKTLKAAPFRFNPLEN